MSSVVFGSRISPRKSKSGYMISVWLPVVVMLLVIVRESTHALSSDNTSAMLRPVYQAVFGATEDEHWEHIHHLLRKTGHFVGYGALGLTWLRAWLYLWLMPLRKVPAFRWRALAWRMAIVCTAVVAALDELHQTYLADRTGMATDVLLDTSGAIAFCGIVGLWWLVTLKCDVHE